MSVMYATLPAYFIIFDLFLLNTILFYVQYQSFHFQQGMQQYIQIYNVSK